MTSPTTTKARPMNGVDVGAMMDTIDAIKGDAAIAKFQFRLRNRWMGGDQNRSTIGSFTGAKAEHRVTGKPFIAENGEPPVLLGKDKAPNPVEWVLHALAGCLTTTTAYHAAARGIEMRAISTELEGDLDLRGFLGLSDKVRKGYSAIRVTMRVETDADVKTVNELCRMSPVLDIVSNSVPVEINIMKG